MFSVKRKVLYAVDHSSWHLIVQQTAPSHLIIKSDRLLAAAGRDKDLVHDDDTTNQALAVGARPGGRILPILCNKAAIACHLIQNSTLFLCMARKGSRCSSSIGRPICRSYTVLEVSQYSILLNKIANVLGLALGSRPGTCRFRVGRPRVGRSSSLDIVLAFYMRMIYSASR